MGVAVGAAVVDGPAPRAQPVARPTRPTRSSSVAARITSGPLRCEPAQGSTKAYQQAMFEQGQRAAMFYVDDVQREFDRIAAAGAEFTMPPTKVTGSTIAVLNDTCGNLIQITKLDSRK
jgi:hypothetical protein